MAKNKSAGGSSKVKAATKGKPNNVSLCSASYSAEQVPGVVLIHAHGFHPTSGYQVFFEQSMLTIFPPEFLLWHIKPSGPVLEVITPFSVSTSFRADKPVEAVVVHDADGKHRVEVEQVPDRKSPGKAAAKKPARAKITAAAATVAADLEPFPGVCFNPIEARNLISGCITGSFDPDKTLKEVGILTANNCEVFKQCIMQKVDDRGCKIKKSDIPCGADTLLRDVRTAVIEKSVPQ